MRSPDVPTELVGVPRPVEVSQVATLVEVVIRVVGVVQAVVHEVAEVIRSVVVELTLGCFVPHDAVKRIWCLPLPPHQLFVHDLVQPDFDVEVNILIAIHAVAVAMDAGLVYPKLTRGLADLA